MLVTDKRLSEMVEIAYEAEAFVLSGLLKAILVIERTTMSPCAISVRKSTHDQLVKDLRKFECAGFADPPIYGPIELYGVKILLEEGGE